MISVKLFKVVANVGNPPLCSGVIAFPSGPKSHTFTVILAVFASQPRWRHKLKLKSFYAVISLYVLHILNSTRERHIYEALIMGSCPWVRKKRKEKENEIFHRKRNGEKKRTTM